MSPVVSVVLLIVIGVIAVVFKKLEQIAALRLESYLSYVAREQTEADMFLIHYHWRQKKTWQTLFRVSVLCYVMEVITILVLFW